MVNPYHKKNRAKKGATLLRWVLRGIAFLCVVALLLSYTSIFVNPAKWWIPYFFGLYYIPIFIINIFLLIILIALKDKCLLLPLVALIPSLYFANMFLKIGNKQDEIIGDEIRFMTYNVGGFTLGKENKTEKETEELIKEFINKERADIVCLQEFKTNNKDKASIKDRYSNYPHIHFYTSQHHPYSGNITLSKYPIISSGEVKFDGTLNLVIYSDIQTTKGIIRVYNCHLESNKISFTSIIKSLSNNRSIKDEFIDVHGRLKNSTIRRSSQVDKIAKLAETSPYPSIICGDFNDTPLSYTYHQLVKKHKDSFIEGGSGFSATYSTLWPLLRIDYILLPKRLQADKHTIHRVPYSDHYPVQTSIYQANRDNE